VAEVTLTIAQRHLLESWGLGLMVLSIGIGLLSLWLNKNAAQPRWRLARPAMLLAMLLGIAMLLLTILAPTAKPVISQPSTATLSTPAARPASQAVAKPAEIAPAPAPIKQALPTPVAASKPPPPVAKPAITASETKKPPSPVAVPLPQPRPAVVPKAVEPTEVRPETAKDAHKANIFSARCSRLLEKVGSGEPMSNAEQQEMVTKCQ
jgi:outer membrane biosynthesis protein TonB